MSGTSIIAQIFVPLKICLFLALVAILFSEWNVLCHFGRGAILAEGIMRNISAKLF